MKTPEKTPQLARGKILAISALCIVSVLAAIALYFPGKSDSESNGSGATSPFREAPTFRLKDKTGQEHTLADYSGKIILVHFWASWCPPCLTELPEILKVAQQFQGRPLELVLISLDDDWKAALKVLPPQGLPANTVSLIDPSLKSADSYGSYQFPETYLLDSKQKIMTKWIGGQQWKGEAIQKFLEKLVKGQEAGGAKS